MQSKFNLRPEEFEKAIEHLKNELAGLRTGRAQSSLVENLLIDYYGTKTPLIQIAQITVPEARMITIQPYDKGALKEIEKAVQTSNLGINPLNDGNLIRLNIPSMTEERRKEMVKIVNSAAEKTRVAIRNIREELVKEIQRQEKDGKMSEDEKITAKESLQETVDKFNDQVKAIAEAKEKEVMTI
ncbi:MAG: ribosome recycling factor [Acidobacteriaceae bacterium]